MILSDDIGSQPLPHGIDKHEFTTDYFRAIEMIGQGIEINNNPEFNSKFNMICRASMKRKLETGLDISNYPQMGVNMISQFLKPIKENLQHSNRPYLIDEKFAVIPQLFNINPELKLFKENFGEIPKLKICVTGPLELYLHTEVGNFVSEDILMNFAESIQRFIRKAFSSIKYAEICVVSIDEPSIGIRDLGMWDDDVLIHALQTAIQTKKGVTTQIHLHSLNSRHIPLQVEGIDVLTCEYAGTPTTLDGVDKRDFDIYDKFLRIGIARTDIDALNLELHEKGINDGFNRVKSGDLSASIFVEDLDIMVHRLKTVYSQFGDRISFSGPDCGFENWPTQEAAFMQLKQAVDAISQFHNSIQH